MEQDITSLKGVKSARAASLAALGIRTVEELLTFYPREYEDRTRAARISMLALDEIAVIYAKLLHVTVKNIRANLSVITASVSDGTGTLTVLFYNQSYIRSKLVPGTDYIFYGKITQGFYGPELCNPAFCTYKERGKFLGIKPIYPLTQGLSQNIMRRLTAEALSAAPPFSDFLPAEVLRKYRLPDRDTAIRGTHFPKDAAQCAQCRRRLIFEELLNIQLMLQLVKKDCARDGKGIALHCADGSDKEKVAQLMNNLPFQLTEAQLRVWAEICRDMESPQEMNRLVLGDVGSGKTILAVLAMLKAIAAGYQAVYMAPTEILAEQHMRTISTLLSPLGIRCVLLTGSLRGRAKQELYAEIEAGAAQCIIGTHALIQAGVSYAKPGLVITDEQHRFGVRQRAKLAQHTTRPDILVMTATPIPRTLALVLYGDMDISVIDAMPKNRKPIRTFIADSALRQRILLWAASLAEQGQQIYIVHPLIQEQEALDLTAAESNFKELTASVFRGLPAALIHGRMSGAEKDQIMRDFVAGKIKILFSTTVIEVGVDVPNAVLIIVENAERFGLAQLHQLRGRVGRGSQQSYCVLFTDHKSKLVRERMQIMKATNDGFLIAEKDLALRGPGDFFGTLQHGLPAFKIADIGRDLAILKETQEAAKYILQHADEPEIKAYIAHVSGQIPNLIAL